MRGTSPRSFTSVLHATLALALLACGPTERDEDARCAVFTDLFVTDDVHPTPWPANTIGDEALELWFPTFVDDDWIGYARQPDGQYVETWSFALPVDGFDDFDLDGLDDAYRMPYDDPNVWGYYTTGPDGLPGDFIPLAVDPLEVVHEWGDLDRDGFIDRTTELGGDFLLVLGSGITISLLPDDFGDESSAGRVYGDPRLLLVSTRYGDEHGFRLVRVADEGVLEELLSSERSPLRVTSRGWSFDGVVDVYLRRGGGEIGELFDLERTRIDVATGMTEHTEIEQGLDGMLLQDYDGDDRPDLFNDPDDGPMWFRFSDEDGDLGPKQTAPSSVPWGDAGILQSFDLDHDGTTELLLAIENDEGRRQWRSLQYERCD